MTAENRARPASASSRTMGALFVTSGVLFVLGVANPAVIGTWSDSTPDALAAAAGHRTAWLATTWLLTLSVVAGIAAVTMLARSLRTDAARAGLAFYLAGATLYLASMTFELTVTAAQIGVPVAPDWYFGMEAWSDGLTSAYFALLGPAAMTCLGAAVVRARKRTDAGSGPVPPAWTGVVLLAAAAALFAQYAAFRGVLPFPQFFAFAALGLAVLARRRPPGADPG